METCEAYGVQYKTFATRLDRGCSLEESLLDTKTRVIGPEGELYRSYAALCRAYGISYQIFKRKIDLGYSLEDAMKRTRAARRQQMK